MDSVKSNHCKTSKRSLTMDNDDLSTPKKMQAQVKSEGTGAVTEAVSATPNSQTIKLDPDGDLVLVVGSQTRAAKFLIDSKTLARSCRFFKQLLYGNFVEAKQPDGGGQWTVNLPDDVAEAMSILLYIMHSHFDKVCIAGSGGEKINKVYNITVLADKYELTRLLRPWAAPWLSNLRPRSKLTRRWAADTVQETRKSLWIAWELGDHGRFLNHLNWLIEALHPAEHELLSNSGVLDPPGFPEILSSLRLESIQLLLRHVQQSLDGLIANGVSSKSLGCKLPPRGSGEIRCNSTIIGSAITQLVARKLWPMPKPDDVTMSVNMLEGELAKISPLAEANHGSTCQRHAFQEFRSGSDPVLPRHFFHRLTDAQRCGLETKAKAMGFTAVSK